MTQDNNPRSYRNAANQRKLLEHIPEVPSIIGYLELRQRTGLFGTDIDAALIELENLGVINSRKRDTDIEVLYWKAGSIPAKEWYSVEDAAKYLSVSKRTVQQLIRDGEMVAYRVGRGGHRRIRRGDLDGPMHREGPSGLVEPEGAEDPVLSELWDNEQDAAYDRI